MRERGWEINANMEDISESKTHDSTAPFTSRKLICYPIRKLGDIQTLLYK